MQTTEKSIQKKELPPALSEHYEIQERLSYSAVSETYLVISREGGRKYIAKIYDRSFVGENTDERLILKAFDHPMLPKFIGSIETEDSICVIRDYMKGSTLRKLKIPIGEMAALNIAIQLCDILTYLHNLDPPVIHRDIKPENIILNSENRLFLIDFDISRQYKPTSVRDTTNFASCGFTAPEQYGFQQTDARTDIFSLGKVLLWLLTESTDILEADKLKNRTLKRVIKKCAAFAPDKRYRSALAVKSVLVGASKSNFGKAVFYLSAAVILFGGSFFWGRYSAPAAMPESHVPMPSASPAVLAVASVVLDDTADYEEYTFIEPLIEEAVRLMLNRDDDEPITHSDLLGVTEIIIFGSYALTDYVQPEPQTFGNIKSVEDFRVMKNLERLFLHRQPFTDISPLKDCLSLEYLQLTYCDMENLAELSALPNLAVLTLEGYRGTDYSFVNSMSALRYFCLFEAQIGSIADFGELPPLETLELPWSSLESLDGIENLPSLRNLNIAKTQITDFSPLNDSTKLPVLATLSIDPEMAAYIHTLERDDAEVCW
ncbi:MAG: protein kinase [Lachnospiraceae bacterium]|nr:protein kinase [Lachnospiraceae bacterium]